MSLLESLNGHPDQVDVTTIKNDRWIIGVFLNSSVKVNFGFIQAVDVVEGQTPVVVVNSRGFNRDGFSVVLEGLFEFSFFKVRKTQVVVD